MLDIANIGSKQHMKLCIRDVTEIHECACPQINEQKLQNY